MTTVSGIGGYCFQNPYLRTAPGRATRRHRGAWSCDLNRRL